MSLRNGPPRAETRALQQVALAGDPSSDRRPKRRPCPPSLWVEAYCVSQLLTQIFYSFTRASWTPRWCPPRQTLTWVHRHLSLWLIPWDWQTSAAGGDQLRVAPGRGGH